MNKSIASVLIGLVFLMPIAMAQAEAKSMSAMNLRFRQMGETFSDFSFNLKSALTFDNEARLDLLKERNAELNTRQQAWVESKNEVVSGFNKSLTAEQKQSLVAIFQAEHESLVEDRLELTKEIREVQLEARSENNAELEKNADAAAKSVKPSTGLLIDIKLFGKGHFDSKSKAKIESEADARAVVKSKLGLESSNSETIVENGVTYYIVSGSETEIENEFVMTKDFEVKVDAETGMIVSADLNVHIESDGSSNAESENSDGSDGIFGLKIFSKARAESSSKAGSVESSESAHASVEDDDEASASSSVSASGSSSASSVGASGSGSIGVSVN